MSHESPAAEPRVLDTYALAYAFSLLFLVPGAMAIGNLQFRTYTFTYVSLVTVPFVLGLLAVFLTDSTDSLAHKFRRSLVLIPLVLMTGVGVMFGSALLIVPVSDFIKPGNFGVLTWVSSALLALVALPLVPALVARMRRSSDVGAWVQALVIFAAIALVAAVIWLTASGSGKIDEFARKDVVIYIIGGLTWYLPSFGISAGVWRRLGLI